MVRGGRGEGRGVSVLLSPSSSSILLRNSSRSHRFRPTNRFDRFSLRLERYGIARESRWHLRMKTMKRGREGGGGGYLSKSISSLHHNSRLRQLGFDSLAFLRARRRLGSGNSEEER